MVMIHGTGPAASLAWSSSAESLSRQYSLYAPDLPGFGRSTFSWDTFQNSSLEELEDLYATWLANYIDAMKLSKPIVVGHSIGVPLFVLKCLDPVAQSIALLEHLIEIHVLVAWFMVI